jgi:hypothetical protein
MPIITTSTQESNMHTEKYQFEYLVSRGMRIQSAKVYAFLNNREVIEAYLGRGAADQMTGQAQGVEHA